MDEYSVKLTSRALMDLDNIYSYIAHKLVEPQTALSQIERIEKAIFSLSQMPSRCPTRKTGAFAGVYRQMFADNFTIVFRIDEKSKTVVVVTVRYSPSQF